ncbi:hypothetical protein QYE76_031399 [Lolium multiflorum]|uniref:Band 7 domain-containing protein n=1 Tax=Lolium multiflorum TaxID=4521 RepID=A0AAD8QRQ3_LOLMU|nr:hypothetical protein QYE76_031399 [Lolium multiflorum]
MVRCAAAASPRVVDSDVSAAPTPIERRFFWPCWPPRAADLIPRQMRAGGGDAPLGHGIEASDEATHGAAVASNPRVRGRRSGAKVGADVTPAPWTWRRLPGPGARRASQSNDNVFVTVVASIQYRPLAGKESDAFYKLTNTRSQIQAYVFDVIRGSVPKLLLDDAFEQKNDIAKAVDDELEKAMSIWI